MPNITIDTSETDVTIDSILSKVTEFDIYQHYFGKFKIGAIYNSPFRKDKNPSFGVFISRNGSLLFKDHGSGQCGNVIKFVELITGLTNYNDILQRINSDLKLTGNTTENIVSPKNYIPKETEIGIVRQKFTESDLTFWMKFGITEKTLNKFNVHSIKYYLCNGIVKGVYSDENPMYAFKVYNKFKIYRPFASKYHKWRNNLTERHIQGYKQLPKEGELCIITKSMKDVMCLYEMGIPAISPSAESCFIPDKALEDIKKRFKRVIILFDRDVTGVRESRKLSLKTGLYAMFMHKSFNAKDISDSIENNNFDIVKDWMYKTLKL